MLSGIAGIAVLRVGYFTMISNYMLQERKISPEVLHSYGIEESRDGVIKFPYIRGGVEYAAKCRTADKKMWSTKDVERGVYNEDAFEFANGPTIITEGEIDCLSLLTVGYDRVISVPNGWNENTQTCEPLFVVRDELSKIQPIVIAGDNDASGSGMPNFVRSLLPDCDVRYVVWPKGCKDANDVLVQHGEDKLRECIEGARELFPDGGEIYDLLDQPPFPKRSVLQSGIPFVDGRIGLELGALSVFTGYPGTGKSTFTTWLAYHVNKHEKAKVGLFAFETSGEGLLNTISGYETGKDWKHLNTDEQRQVRDRIQGNFFIVNRIYNSAKAATHNLGWLMDFISALVVRNGVKLVIVDPWNELEHLPERGESMTNYINYALQQIRQLAERLHIHIMIVAHPRKPSSDGEPTHAPTGYDIADSAAFANKPSLGLSIYKKINEAGSEDLSLITWKVRDVQLYGFEKGATSMEFNKQSKTYESFGAEAYAHTKGFSGG